MSKGSSIEIIRRNDGKYREWYWCRTGDGNEAFVPGQVLEVNGSTGTFLRDYNSLELTVSRGDILIMLYEMGGWTLARKSTGEEGWVPSEYTEPYDAF